MAHKGKGRDLTHLGESQGRNTTSTSIKPPPDTVNIHGPMSEVAENSGGQECIAEATERLTKVSVSAEATVTAASSILSTKPGPQCHILRRVFACGHAQDQSMSTTPRCPILQACTCTGTLCPRKDRVTDGTLNHHTCGAQNCFETPLEEVVVDEVLYWAEEAQMACQTVKNIMKAWFSRYANHIPNDTFFSRIDYLIQVMTQSRTVQTQILQQMDLAHVMPSAEYIDAFQRATTAPRDVNIESAAQIDHIERTRQDTIGSQAAFTTGRPQLPDYDLLVRPFSRRDRIIPAPMVSARVRRNFRGIGARRTPQRWETRSSVDHSSRHIGPMHELPTQDRSTTAQTQPTATAVQSDATATYARRPRLGQRDSDQVQESSSQMASTTNASQWWRSSRAFVPAHAMTPIAESPSGPSVISQQRGTGQSMPDFEIARGRGAYVPLPPPPHEPGAPPGYSSWDRLPGREAFANDLVGIRRLATSPTAYVQPAWESAMEAESFFSRLSVQTQQDAELLLSLPNRPRLGNPILPGGPAQDTERSDM